MFLCFLLFTDFQWFGWFLAWKIHFKIEIFYILTICHSFVDTYSQDSKYNHFLWVHIMNFKDYLTNFTFQINELTLPKTWEICFREVVNIVRTLTSLKGMEKNCDLFQNWLGWSKEELFSYHKLSPKWHLGAP